MSATATSNDDIIREVAGKVVCQPDTALSDCAYYAILNLYVRLGLEPPTIERMKGLCSPADPLAGLTELEMLMLMCELNIPR